MKGVSLLYVPSKQACFNYRMCDCQARLSHRGLPSCEGICLLSFVPRKDSMYELVPK